MRVLTRMKRLCLPTMCCAAVLVSGCGSGGSRNAVSSTVAVAVDCSRSVRGDQASWDHQLAVLASEVLPAEERMLVGCFAGERTGVEWLAPFDPSILSRLTGGQAAVRAARVRWGLSLEPLFARRLQVRDVDGTDWLSALQSSSQVSHLGRVYLFSDLVQEDEGVNLTREMSLAALESVARRWAEKLSNLRGSTVVEVGGGSKLSGGRPDTQGVTLFEDLARLVGFHGELLSTLS